MPARPRAELYRLFAAPTVLALALAAPAAACVDPGPEAESSTEQALLPLLGSKRGGSPLWDFCYGKTDATVLPPDPRSLIQPGVNAGNAVLFNTYWKDCHVDPVAVQEAGHATTCGELRARFYRGDGLLDTGGPKVGTLFAGNTWNTPESLFGITLFTAGQYNDLWKSWGGFLFRPDNFDQLVSERYGSGLATTRNPYPKPFENPNLTNGGTGQLPEMFTQVRNSDGSWSGRIGVTCHACHTGVVGTPADGPGLGVTYGGSSSLADLDLFLSEMLPRGYPVSIATLANLNHTRGRNNASDINLAFLFPDQGFLSIPTILGVLTSGTTADIDTPAWWNMGHRPAKFVDGVFPMDAPRVDMVFYTPFMGIFGSLGGWLSEAGQTWMRQNGPDLNTWVDTLKSPAYPMPINTALAEQGAQLFHTLDMWAPARNNTVPRPVGGNGSCASCHGAYSPRYVNDTAFLGNPALEGMAAYITPMNIIGTDPVRLDANNNAVQVAGASNFFGYPSTRGTPNDCGPQNQPSIRGNRALGYLAPPLYGVWATAPYLHNGSVPNMWEVLKPADRKPIWRRVSKPARSDQQGRVIMGFDTDLARAYDQAKGGWKYDTIACQWRSIFNPSVTPYFNCDPNDQYNDPLAQQITAGLFSNLVLTWNILFPPTVTPQQKEDRKIFNTHLFGQGNEGHAFNSVLTDAERLAIIEYLKTL